MKKNIFLAVVGAAALAGCTSNEVMKERGFVPAPKDDSEVTAMAPVKGAPEAEVNRTREAPGAQRRQSGRGPAAAEFPPMTGDFGGKGLSGDGASAGSGEYIVKSGDTLGKIAAAHRVKLSSLMKANNLTEKDAKRLRVGRKLTIPEGRDAKRVSKSEAKRAKAERKGDRSFGKNGDKAAIQPGEYIVKAGDTPERIARRAGVKLSALMEANKLTEQEARRLRIGQKLNIPENGKAVKSADKAAKTAEKPAKSSDELVSEMNKAELKESAEQTPAAAPAAAPAIPESAAAPAAAEESEVVVVPAEISLADFAKQHNTTPDELRRLNPDLKGDKLSKDAFLLIPKK